MGRRGADADGAQLSRLMIERVLTACRDLSPEEAGKLMALLRRFEAEAARDEARHIAGALADEAALAVVLEHAPRRCSSTIPNPRSRPPNSPSERDDFASIVIPLYLLVRA